MWLHFCYKELHLCYIIFGNNKGAIKQLLASKLAAGAFYYDERAPRKCWRIFMVQMNARVPRKCYRIFSVAAFVECRDKGAIKQPLASKLAAAVFYALRRSSHFYAEVTR